jgi:hypothetical protein
MEKKKSLMVVLGIIFGACLLLQSTVAQADERLRLECRGKQGFFGAAWLWWTQSGWVIAGPEYFSCSEGNRTLDQRVQAPQGADGYIVDISVFDTVLWQGNFCESWYPFNRLNNRSETPCQVDPAHNGPKAVFKFNR